MQKLSLLAGLAVLLAGCAITPDDGQGTLRQNAQNTVADFRQTDPGIDKFFKSAVGYAVFPSIGKGGVGIGGAYGRGLVYENGKQVGWCMVRQGSIGVQLGGQSFQQIIFFQEARTLSNFKVGKFEFAANASAVAVRRGAAASADYEQGVAVFVAPKGGLMFEASIGGQKFAYEAMD
jgi:lipid-binding SYLF domain-containing protein